MTDDGFEGQPDDDIATFVIRIRAEGVGVTDRNQGWVGHITNVLDHRGRYVRTFTDLATFIDEYMVQMGVGSNERVLLDPKLGLEEDH